MRILLVDDNPQFRAFVRRYILRTIDANAEIHECVNGAEAVTMYDSLKSDWVVMDIAMDTMDGLTAAKQIRENNPQARIIILSQLNEPAYKKTADELGLSGFVAKDRIADLRSLLT